MTAGPPLSLTDPATEALFHDYVIHQERRGNLRRSIDARMTKLRAFARWLEPRSLLEATTEDVETFLDSRHTHEGRPIIPNTRFGWISHLHAFYEWTLRELAGADPTARIIRPRVRRTLPRPIDDEDLRQAIAEAPPQMAAMLSLAAYAGLRCQEIAGIDRSDVIEAKGLLRVVKGKGGHERIVPLHTEALAALRQLPMPRTGPVFTRPRGGPFPPWCVSSVIADYLRELGIDASAHQLRHWFATSVYATSHDIRLTQELLGHQSPNTTAIYVAFSSVEAAEAVQSLRIGD